MSNMKFKKVFSRIEMNIFMAVIGACVLISSSMMFFIGDYSETIQKVSISIAVVGIILVILQCIIKVEKNDERSFENASKAGDFTALVIQATLALTGAAYVIFKDYMNAHSDSQIIFMILGLLIMIRALAFIKFERSGE